MAKPQVSVVMCVFNGETYLEAAVKSILSQTYTAFEFVILDDGSSDRSPEIMRNHARNDRRIRAYYQDNMGIAGALNRANSLATGRYIAHLDQDDVAFADRLERQMAFLKENPLVSLVGGAAIMIGRQGAPIMRVDYPRTDDAIKATLRHSDPSRTFAFLHSATVILARDIHALGGYRSAMTPAEDYDLFQRVAECRTVANLSDPVVYYRLHQKQTSVMRYNNVGRSIIAAHAAARLRRETGIDPFHGAEKLTSVRLARAGISEENIMEFVERYERYRKLWPSIATY